MSVTSADPKKAARSRELLDAEAGEIDPAPQRRGPVPPGRLEPSDGELLAQAER